MEYLIASISLGIALFVATNLDDLFLIVGFFTDKRFTSRQIVLSQFIGLGTLTLVSLVAAQASVMIAEAYIGLLGIAPIIIGIKELLEKEEEGDDAKELENKLRGHGRLFTLTAITLANGGDNVGVYIPAFATMQAERIVVILIVFAVLTLAMCFAGYWLVNHPRVGAPMRTYGPKLVPYVLIALGVFVLVEADTFSLFR